MRSLDPRVMQSNPCDPWIIVYLAQVAVVAQTPLTFSYTAMCTKATIAHYCCVKYLRISLRQLSLYWLAFTGILNPPTHSLSSFILRGVIIIIIFFLIAHQHKACKR
jgi:hypothetical protein